MFPLPVTDALSHPEVVPTYVGVAVSAPSVSVPAFPTSIVFGEVAVPTCAANDIDAGAALIVGPAGGFLGSLDPLHAKTAAATTHAALKRTDALIRTPLSGCLLAPKPPSGASKARL